VWVVLAAMGGTSVEGGVLPVVLAGIDGTSVAGGVVWVVLAGINGTSVAGGVVGTAPKSAPVTRCSHFTYSLTRTYSAGRRHAHLRRKTIPGPPYENDMYTQRWLIPRRPACSDLTNPRYASKNYTPCRPHTGDAQ
jgi:hypothetical protein